MPLIAQYLHTPSEQHRQTEHQRNSAISLFLQCCTIKTVTSSAHKCCTSCSADKLTNYNVDKTDARQSREEVLRNNITENPSELIWHGITTRAVHMCSACVPNVNKSVYKTILTQSTQYTQYRPAQTWSIQQLQCVCLITYMYQ